MTGTYQDVSQFYKKLTKNPRNTCLLCFSGVMLFCNTDTKEILDHLSNIS